MVPKSEAPWTDEQVGHLLDWQQSDYVHPFTCPSRGDGKHKDNGHDLGILTPTRDGWACESCNYRQSWAHEFMVNGAALSRMEEDMKRLGFTRVPKV